MLLKKKLCSFYCLNLWGYTPRSRRSATAYTDFSIIPPENSEITEINYTLKRDTIFASDIGGTLLTPIFYPSQDVTATLQDVDGVGKISF